MTGYAVHAVGYPLCNFPVKEKRGIEEMEGLKSVICVVQGQNPSVKEGKIDKDEKEH